MSELVYSPKTLAEHWECDEQLVRKLIRSGELEAFKLGGTLWRITQEAVEEYQRCQTIGSDASRDNSLSFTRRALGAADTALARATREKLGQLSENLSKPGNGLSGLKG